MKNTRLAKNVPPGTETSLSRCLVGGGAGTESRGRRKALGASIVIETAALLALVMSPLLTSVAHPQFHMSPPMQIVLGAWHARETNQHSVSQPIRPVQVMAVPIAETTFPKPLVKGHDDVEGYEPPISDLTGEDVPGAIQMSGPGIAAPAVEPPIVEQQSLPEKRAVKVSEGVQQAQLISRVEPRYSALALQTRTEGIVHLRAIISRDGHIKALEVLSGSPLLVHAALDAVRQWRYRPTLLSGEPVEVETSITVIFRLNQ